MIVFDPPDYLADHGLPTKLFHDGLLYGDVGKRPKIHAFLPHLISINWTILLQICIANHNFSQNPVTGEL